MTTYTYTEQQLRDAISSSSTLRQVLAKLMIVPAGGNYATVRGRIALLGIDTSTLKGHAWSRGMSFPLKSRPISDYLGNSAKISSHKLKLKLIKANIFEHRCHICRNNIWMGLPIPLELDHIDGKHSNNILDNLRLLCPNCHAQTPNYRGEKYQNQKNPY